jgi:ABC-type Fe3+-hydroxamate transport system substrate-binding protein
MRIRGLFVGLSVLALTISGCSSTSNSNEATQTTEKPAVADTRCNEANQTIDQSETRVNYLNERHDELSIKDPTDEEFGELIREINEITSERYTTLRQVYYIIIDNPQCFTPADVAWARSSLEE